MFSGRKPGDFGNMRRKAVDTQTTSGGADAAGGRQLLALSARFSQAMGSVTFSRFMGVVITPNSSDFWGSK